MDLFILIFELIGTVAFAASGAMTGIKKNMDIFGVCILALTTAVGGGVIRDLILGNTPPATFRDPIYATVALVAALVLFFSRVRRLLMHNTVLFDKDGRFYGVHVVVTDSNVVMNKTATNTPEIYTNLLQLNSRLSGVGSETGETDCDGKVLAGATWETRDNFEMLARFAGKPAEVRMIRLNRDAIPEGTRLCDYMKYLLMY